MNTPPLYLDKRDLKHNWVDNEFSTKKFYENTLFSIVNETNYFTDIHNPVLRGIRVEPSRFLSEKTFKPVAEKHPFIMVSVPHMLDKFKELGYKSFSPYIDESYDLKDNIQDRIKIIISELHRFSSMSPKERQQIREEMKPVFEYNKKLVWELTCKQQDLINILEQISNESIK